MSFLMLNSDIINCGYLLACNAALPVNASHDEYEDFINMYDGCAFE